MQTLAHRAHVARAAVTSRNASSVRAVTTTSPQFVVKDEKAAPLFAPFQLGHCELSSRVVMAPLTRMRGTPDNIPTPIMAEYYKQRAHPGCLIITEGTFVSPESNGYHCAPGQWSQEQVEAWKPIVQGIKSKGGYVFNQLFHCGRASHPNLQPGGIQPVGPSAIPITDGTQLVLRDWSMAEYPVPQEVDEAGIQAIIRDFVTASKNAISAGFDGVEIHGASGYLIAQFLSDSANQRTDQWGGSIENRARFPLAVIDAVVGAIGAERVGLRLGPWTTFLSAYDSTPYATYTYLVERLAQQHPHLAYLHFVDFRPSRSAPDVKRSVEPFRKVWRGPFIVADGYTAHSGAEAITAGRTDLVAYGRNYISNPDLPYRFAVGAPLNAYDRSTFYGGSDKGYTDYPTLEQA